MAKKFNIHDWQQKHLFEQDDFTPDLEDDDLKRSKIQQMMAKEKESEYELSDEEKDNLTDMTNEFVRKLTDVRGGNYSGDRLLAALQFVILNIQDMEPMLYTDTDEDGIPDVVDNDEELDENMTGGGTFNAGNGEGYSTPKAFAKKGKWNGKKAVYEQEDEEVDNIDIERVQQLFSKSINKEGEWMKILELLVDHSKEIPGLSDLDVKNSLIQSVKGI